MKDKDMKEIIKRLDSEKKFDSILAANAEAEEEREIFIDDPASFLLKRKAN